MNDFPRWYLALGFWDATDQNETIWRCQAQAYHNPGINFKGGTWSSVLSEDGSPMPPWTVLRIDPGDQPLVAGAAGMWPVPSTDLSQRCGHDDVAWAVIRAGMDACGIAYQGVIDTETPVGDLVGWLGTHTYPAFNVTDF